MLFWIGGNKMKRTIYVSIALLILIGTIMMIVFLNSSKIRIVDFNEAKKELESYKFGEYENLKFNCSVPVIQSDKVYEISIDKGEQSYNEETSREEFISMLNSFFGIEINKENIHNKSNSSIEYIHYSENSTETTDKYAIAYASKTFLLNNEQELNMIRYGKDSSSCLPFIDLKEISSGDLITLNNKEVNLLSFVKEAEKEINRCCKSFFNEGEELRPYDAVKMRSSVDESEYITLRFSHILNGIEINEDGYSASPGDGQVTLPSFVTVEMNDEGKIASIQNYYYYNINDSSEISQIVPLSEATEHLSKELAPNLNYTVNRVDLKYVNLAESGQKEGALRPMWCYTIDEYNGGYGEPSNFFLTKTAFVDAQNGNVYITDSKERTFEIHEI